MDGQQLAHSAMLQRHVCRCGGHSESMFYSVGVNTTGVVLWVNQGTKENKEKLEVTISQAFWIHGLEHI